MFLPEFKVHFAYFSKSPQILTVATFTSSKSKLLTMSPYKIIKVIYLQYTMAQSEYSHPSKELGAGQEKSGQTPDSVVPCSTCGAHDGIIWALPLALGNRTPVVLSPEASTAFFRLPFFVKAAAFLSYVPRSPHLQYPRVSAET